jgi:hypothetical protein
MRKTLLSILFFSSISLSYGQIFGGAVKDEGRKLLTETTFTYSGHVNGYATFELAVDREGNVTGTRLLETNIKSTPAMLTLKKEIVKLKFEKGNHYPAHHHAEVRFTLSNAL